MAQQQSAPARRGGFFRGWWIVFAGGLHGFIGYGGWMYNWSVFVPYFLRGFNLTAAQIAVSRTIGGIVNIPEGPLAGWMIERWGPRVLATISFVMAGIGWIGIGLIPGPEQAFWFINIFYGIFVLTPVMTGLYQVSQVTAAKWFIKRRGMAIGLITVGTGFGSTILVPLTQWAVLNVGWQSTAIAIGVLTMILCISTTWLFFPPHPPEHYGLRPDNVSEEEYRQTQEAAAAGRVTDRLADTAFTPGQILRLWQFWTVALAYVGYGMSGIAMPLFQNIAMQEGGYSATEAANFYGLNFFFTIFGRASVAAIGDRFNPRWAAATYWILMAVGYYAFSNAAAGVLWVWLWVVIHGYAYGSVIPAHGIMRVYYFGRAGFGHVFGWFNAVFGFTAIVAPIFVGWTRDVSGTYHLAFYFSAATVLFAALMMAITPKPKPKAVAQAPATT